MSTVLPYTAKDLSRLIAEGRNHVERHAPDLLATMCHDLLPWAGRADVDRTLGMLLKLFLRHASTAKVAEIEAEAFPLDRLRHGWNPQDASIAYLGWKYRQAFGPERDPDLEQARVLVAAAQALWPHLDEATRLQHGLHVKLATAHGALGDARSLRELGEGLLAGPLNDEREQAAWLRIIKQLQRMRAVAELEGLLEPLLARPGSDLWRVDATLTALAALSTSAQNLSEHQRVARVLGPTFLWLQRAGARLYDERLVTSLLRCAEFERLHELLPHLMDDVGDAAARSALLSMLGRLFRHEQLGDAGQYIERVYRQDPGDPAAAILFGRFLLGQGMSHEEIAPIFETLRPDAARYDEAVLWIAQLHGVWTEYEQVIRWLDAHPLNDPDKARPLLNLVQAAMERPSLPSSADAADSERLNALRLGSLLPLLLPLVEALNGDLSHSAQPPVEELRSKLQGVVLAAAKAIRRDGSLTPRDCLRAARELMRAANVHLRDMVEQQRGSPVVLGPQHGTMDCTRVTVVFEAFLRVVVALSQFGVERALRGAPLADVRDLCQLVETHTESALALDEPQASEALLQALRDRHVAPSLVLRLLERCALHRGDIHAAADFVAGQPGIGGEMLRLKPFDAWIRAEAVSSDVLVHQAPWRGMFDYVDVQGAPHQAPLEVPATQVDLLHVPGLRVRDTEILIGPNGSIPRPHPWHFRDVYGYPREGSIRLNYGQRGCRLRPSAERLHICEPVVALVNMDGPYWHNYYHWMLPILTRVAVLLDRGMFEHRRLLVPMELSGWMMASLELAGLPEERMLRYRAEQEVQADDAMVVGPVEFSAAALIKPLQRRLWDAAGVDTRKAVSGPALWLSRRHQYRRYLANADAIEALVQRLGFEVVVPESLSLVDQVRLCAHATAIAGSAGANLTNLMFARPGTPILGLVGEDNNYPTFVDLCAVLDLPQRWLFGRMDPRKSWWGTYHEPFEVDMAVLERELRRLVAAGPLAI